MKNISFDNPYLLLLLIPLLLAIIIPIIIAIRKENRHKSVFISLALHIIISVCVILALAGMIHTTVMTETQVIVVADVSYSGDRNLDKVDAYIGEIQSKLPKNSKLAVVVFGKDSKLLCDFDAETIPSVKGSGVDNSATDIAQALDYAVGLYDEGVIKRMIVLTDGKETAKDAAGKLVAAVENVYAEGIYIDAVYLDNNLAEDQKEIQLSDVEYAPSTYMNHEATAEVLIQSSYDTGAIAVLYVEGERVSNQAIKLQRGYNIISIDLPTGSTGRYDYRVAITADGDYCTTNNTFDFTQTIVAGLQVLLVSNDEADLAKAQQLYGDRAEIDAYIGNPDVPCTVEELCKYDEIMISNVDIRELHNYTAFIDGVEKVVSRFGKSLVTLGDLKIQNKSDNVLQALEDMLPVKYGNSDQDPKLYAIVIDTSRSMQNFSRLKIAKQAAIQLMNMLDDNDYVMVVNFWGEINVLQSPIKAVHREEIATLINNIQPYQGTVIGTALDKAGELMIDMAYDDKQIMLISDGMSYTLESDTPADVVTRLHDNGITTSVIHPAARDEGKATLQGIAEAGGGSYFEIITEESLLEIMFSEIADDLTQSVIEGQTPVHIKREHDTVLSGIASVPDIMGYAYAKAKASATTVLTVDFVKTSGNIVEAPLYAYWAYGNGRVSSFTSTLTGEWASTWENESGDRFFENVLVENTPAQRVDYPYTIDVTYDGSHSTVEIIPVTLNPFATTDVTVTLPDGSTVTERLTFDSTRYFYAFETPLRGRYLINVTYAYADKSFESESAFHVGYAPEYDQFAVFDPAALHAAIRNRGGVYEGTIPSLENDDKEVATYTVRYLVPLMIAAVALYVIDIIIRKLRWSDIKSFFSVKKKGGSR
ncbi:MAG: VWA domain-containing protein [Clostridia bacterium]|nr:VWA domain-containing protein [Clostridia bacterium]